MARPSHGEGARVARARPQPGPDRALRSGNRAPPPFSALDGLIAEIAAAAEAPLARRHLAVAAALRPWLARADLLAGRALAPRDDRYARHLLHADPDGRFALLALVWRPGQASPVHAHRAWCAFGVAEGALAETWFAAPEGAEAPAALRTARLLPGAVGGGPASPDAIHRLACLDPCGALSLHVYGVAGDAIETGVNRVYA